MLKPGKAIRFSKPAKVLSGIAISFATLLLIYKTILCLIDVAWTANGNQEDHRRRLIEKQPLMNAIYHHNLPEAAHLLDAGADANMYCDGIGPEEVPETALMLAAEVGDVGMIDLLLAKGAYLNDVDGWGFTATDYAFDHRRHDAARLLRRYGGIQTPPVPENAGIVTHNPSRRDID